MEDKPNLETDQELIQLIRDTLSKDKRISNAAFEKLIKRYNREINQITHKLKFHPNTGVEDDDVRQACLDGLWEACRAYDQVRPFTPFACILMRSKTLNILMGLKARKHKIFIHANRFTDINTSTNRDNDNIANYIPDKKPLELPDISADAKRFNELVNCLSEWEQRIVKVIYLMGDDAFHNSSLSYQAIVEEYARQYGETITYKQVDNGISRIRQKAGGGRGSGVSLTVSRGIQKRSKRYQAYYAEDYLGTYETYEEALKVRNDYINGKAREKVRIKESKAIKPKKANTKTRTKSAALNPH